MLGLRGRSESACSFGGGGTAQKALELRRGGLDFPAIAEALKLEDVDEARALYEEALSEVVEVDESGILSEIDRVDRLHRALWPKALKGDTGAVDRLLRLQSRRLQLVDAARRQSEKAEKMALSRGKVVEWEMQSGPGDAGTSQGLTDYTGVDMPNTTAHLRPRRNTRARLSKVANAKDTIEGFDHDMDVCALTFGQFSLLDLIDAALLITGPADVVVCTWSAGFYDVEAAERFRDSGRLRSIRFIMDSGAKRGQANVGDVAQIFGEGCVRATRTHAKFALIANDDWKVVITSSMNLNLNLNPRCEQFEMTDDPDRYAMFDEFVGTVFDELPAGDTGDRQLPLLQGMSAVKPNLGFQYGGPIRTGRWD